MNTRQSKTRGTKRLTPKQRVLERFPAAFLRETRPGEDQERGEPWAVCYKQRTRLTDGVLAYGPTPQTAWDEAEREIERSKRRGK